MTPFALYFLDRKARSFVPLVRQMESGLQSLEQELFMTHNGLLDLPSGVWVGDYVPKGKLIQKGEALYEFSKDEVRCLDLNRWGWSQCFSAHHLNEKVLHVDHACLYTEKAVYLYTASTEKVSIKKVFQHDHDVRSLVVVNEFIFAAYYKTGEIQVFERNEETFYLQDCFMVWGDSAAEHLYRSMVRFFFVMAGTCGEYGV